MVEPDISANDRLQRIESSLAISQLPSRYAMALGGLLLASAGLATYLLGNRSAGARKAGLNGSAHDSLVGRLRARMNGD